MSKGRRLYAVSGPTKTKSALCGLTLELSGCRRRRTILAQTDIGSPLERIVRPQHVTWREVGLRA